MNFIFDMDGLMFDTERIFIKAWDYAGEQMGIGKAGFMTMKTLGMNIATANEIWRAEFGDGYHPDKLRRYTKEFLSSYYVTHKVPVKKGLHSLLEYLKEQNAKVGLATSAPRWEVEHHLKDAGVYDYFEVIVCGDMIEKSKPDPEIYWKACKLLRVHPTETFALEDSKSGILSAYHAGCKPIMIPDLWQPDDEILTCIVHKFDSLEQVRDAIMKGEIAV